MTYRDYDAATARWLNEDPIGLAGYRPTAAGTTLTEVRALGVQVGVPLKAVRREAGAPLVTPAIVHLGFDHLSAVLEEVDDRFRVRDPALGGEVWMPREALDEEMTGSALIPVNAVAAGWRDLSDTEAAAIVGHSCPPGIPDPDECPCPESEPGMPTYSLHPTQASVLLSDAPLGYSPPRGPGVSLQLRYNHREENQPQLFAFANLGAKWSLNWLAYLEEVPFTWFDQYGQLAYAQPAHVAVHVPQGGVERYAYPYADGTYPRHYRSAAVLALVSSTPLVYERRHPDGSTEVYGLSDGGVPGTRINPNGGNDYDGEAHDTGAGWDQNHHDVPPDQWIDIWLPCKDAKKWGKQYRNVLVCDRDSCH